MAINHIDFFSKKLKMNTKINVILPEFPDGNEKVLLLLHGLTSDENSWLTQTRLAGYAMRKHVAIIMPRVDRSYYTNIVDGSQYFDYIADEVLQRCRQWFNLPTDPDKCYVAGVSMGGFGALKVGLTHPNQFKQIFALSAMLDIVRSWQNKPERDGWYRRLFGSPEQVIESDNDIAYLISQQTTNAPAIWQLCGVEDPFYAMNQTLDQQIKKQGLTHEFLEVPGAHEWGVWDPAIQQILEIIDQA
ncbi:tributyrin esterase [Weissella hellenica]|nr:tributyrin esterase [Weissella hellenica]